MSYQSTFTGAQVDAAVHRASAAVGGGIYMIDNATLTAIATTQTFTKVAGTTILFPDSNEMDMPANNRLRHNNGTTDQFVVDAHLSVFAESLLHIRARLYKNNAPIPGSDAVATLAGQGGAGRYTNLAMAAVVDLSPGDYVEVFIANWTNTTDLDVVDMRLLAFRS